MPSHSSSILKRAILISCDHFAFVIHFQGGNGRKERKALNMELQQQYLRLVHSKLPLMTEIPPNKTLEHFIYPKSIYFTGILYTVSSSTYTVHWRINLIWMQTKDLSVLFRASLFPHAGRIPRAATGHCATLLVINSKFLFTFQGFT